MADRLLNELLNQLNYPGISAAGNSVAVHVFSPSDADRVWYGLFLVCFRGETPIDRPRNLLGGGEVKFDVEAKEMTQAVNSLHVQRITHGHQELPSASCKGENAARLREFTGNQLTHFVWYLQ